MGIVLNEYTWAENALREKDLGGHPTETLYRIAKYYLYTGIDKKTARTKLEQYLSECNPSANMVRWSDTLDRVMKYADKYPLITVNSVKITEPEMEIIQSIDSKQTQRLAFTLLCLAKYYYAVSEKNNYWVGTPDSEIMKMANVKSSVKRQSLMFGQLRELGLLKFSKKIDNLSVQVLFAAEGDTAIEINDFRNLGYQYLKYLGGAYFSCECCGITVKMMDSNKGGRKKYCEECAIKVHTKQKVNSVMRRRSVTNFKSVDNSLGA